MRPKNRKHKVFICKPILSRLLDVQYVCLGLVYTGASNDSIVHQLSMCCSSTGLSWICRYSITPLPPFLQVCYGIIFPLDLLSLLNIQRSHLHQGLLKNVPEFLCIYSRFVSFCLFQWPFLLIWVIVIAVFNLGFDKYIILVISNRWNPERSEANYNVEIWFWTGNRRVQDFHQISVWATIVWVTGTTPQTQQLFAKKWQVPWLNTRSAR